MMSGKHKEGYVRPSPPRRKGVFVGGYLKRGLVYEIDTLRKANEWTQTQALEAILAAGITAIRSPSGEGSPESSTTGGKLEGCEYEWCGVKKLCGDCAEEGREQANNGRLQQAKREETRT